MEYGNFDFQDMRGYNVYMGYMQFKNPTLEQLFKSYKWTRNNTIKIFDEALRQNVLDYRSSSAKPTKHTFQPIFFQFQCIVSTTDAYYRKLTDVENQSYGIYIENGEIIPKDQLTVEQIKKILPKQLKELEALLKTFDEKKTEKLIDKVFLLGNHEYLHQGELILMFREAGAELPATYVRAWAL